MRILLTPVGTRGDVVPLIVLGQGLQAAGHEVLFCSPPDSGKRVRAAGLEFHTLGSDIRAFVTERAAAVAERVGRREPVREMVTFLETAVGSA